MKNQISPLSLFNYNKLRVLLSLGFKGYLVDKGWFKAFKTKSSIDENGQPIPWVTYSFIDVIKERINNGHDILEFGSGNSTIFYAKNARSVYSVENDKEWFDRNAGLNLPNVQIVHCPVVRDGDYSKSGVSTGRKFHIIIVDGRDRVNCCKQAIHSLTEDGVIVLDDSEREKYQEAHAFFKANGFLHLPFTGMAPGVIISKCTSIFYKHNNCLGI